MMASLLLAEGAKDGQYATALFMFQRVGWWGCHFMVLMTLILLLMMNDDISRDEDEGRGNGSCWMPTKEWY